ncbi:MAG: hypothetical protein HRU20_00335 [Pseudomonadales bacterium]|nr:hypothetical protein [Pseudomonadales bacterium]
MNTKIHLPAIRHAIKQQNFDLALGLLEQAHQQFHANPVPHLKIHALWILYLIKKHGIKPPARAFAFQCLALCFSMPVSLFEKLLLSWRQ